MGVYKLTKKDAQTPEILRDAVTLGVQKHRGLGYWTISAHGQQTKIWAEYLDLAAISARMGFRILIDGMDDDYVEEDDD